MESRNGGVPPRAPGSLGRRKVRAPASRPRREDPLGTRARRQRKPGESQGRRRGPGRAGRLAASGQQGAASPVAAAALVPDSASFGRHGDLGRRAASAGHGGVEPGRGRASASRNPPGERGRGPSHSPRGRNCAGTAGRAGVGETARGGRRAGPGASPPFSHSLICWFILSVATGTERSVRPGACWGSSPVGWGLRPRGTDT